MKKYFTSGLAILLPILLTLFIVNFLINFLTQPFLESTKILLGKTAFSQHSTLITVASKALILLFLMGFIVLVGLLGQLFFIHTLFRFGNNFFNKLPFVNKVYKACQDVVHTLFSSSSKSFSQVVFVPFPHADHLSVGLVTGDSVKLQQPYQDEKDLVSVFVPGTPNPSVGFMLLFKREQLIFVNMKVDEAMKFVVSCGIVMPDFTIIQPHVMYENPIFSESDLLSCQR